MPAITVQQLNDASLDVGHIIDYATSTAPLVTDRFGVQKVSLRGASDRMDAKVAAVEAAKVAATSSITYKVGEVEVAKLAANQLMADKANSVIGITDRGAWVTGTAYAVKDVFSNSGTWYVTVIAHTSSASFASDAANVRVYQGVTTGDLAAQTTSAALGHIADGVGMVARTIKGKLSDFPSVKDFGAVGNGIADDTAAVQAAFTKAGLTGGAIFVNEGRYRLTAPIVVNRGLTIYGVSPVVRAPTVSGVGGGSWLYFDHTGKGLTAINATGYATNFIVEDIGTYRNQPASSVGWTPTAHDFDFYSYGVSDVTYTSLLLLNPTKGICMDGDVVNTCGRLNVYDVKMQAFQVGIKIDVAYDVCRIDQLHVWPFWLDDMNLHTYCMNNLDAIYMLRNDNPMLSNIFSIFARSGLRIGQSAAGGTSKIHMVNADFDRGAHGIWVDNTVTSGTSGQFENITHQSELGILSGMGLLVQGIGCKLSFGGFRSDYAPNNAVRIEGVGNHVTFCAAVSNNNDQLALGFPAFEAASLNSLIFATPPVVTGAGSGGRFSSSGYISTEEWRSFTPAVTSLNGAITTQSATGFYKVVGSTVSISVDINITNNGTASGDIRFPVPFGSPIITGSGIGRETNVSGKSLIVYCPSNGGAAASVFIYDYNNQYPIPASTGRIVGSVEYQSYI